MRGKLRGGLDAEFLDIGGGVRGWRDGGRDGIGGGRKDEVRN